MCRSQSPRRGAKWGRHDPIEDGEEPWGHLLHEACNRFAQEYAHHPLINCIAPGAVRIFVTTALYPPQFIEELPSLYCGFVVEQEPINAGRDYYLRYWRILFSELLGWSEAQTLEWALQWDDDLNGRRANSMFYHEDPYHYALPEIIRASGASRSGPGCGTRVALQDAIQYNASSPIWLSPVDWDAARARVNTILDPIGGRLPR